MKTCHQHFFIVLQETTKPKLPLRMLVKNYIFVMVGPDSWIFVRTYCTFILFFKHYVNSPGFV